MQGVRGGRLGGARGGSFSMESPPQVDARQRARADTYYKTAGDAYNKGNYPYAVKMLQDALAIDPVELKYRQVLRAAQRKTFKDDPSKVGMLVGAKLQPVRLRMRSARGRGHWLHLLEVCEEAFAVNPWDVGAAMEGSEAALELKLPALGQWLMESVQKQAEKDPHYWRHMAKVYEANQAYPKAIACWERVKQLVPHDEEASRQVNALSASATIARSGLHQAIEKGQAAGRSGPEPEVPEEVGALRGRPALSAEQRFERDVAEEPQSSRPYLEMAEHLRMQDRLDEAKEVLGRGLQALPEDPALREQYAEIQIGRLKKAIDGLQKRLREQPDDADAATRLEKLGVKLRDYELTEFRRRVGSRPDDVGLRFELGKRLAAAGQHDEAIAEFQAARSSPALKVQALLHAGQSFEANGVLKLAERQYTDALKAAEADDVALVNQLRYRLGRVAEDLGNLAAAEEHYNEVAANNYGYLDVAARLRSLNQRQAR